MTNCIRCDREIEEEYNFCPFCGQNQTRAPATRSKRGRRGNGEGSVYKRSDRKSSPFVAVSPCVDGKRTVIGYYQTAKDAKDALTSFCEAPTEKINFTLEKVYQEWSAEHFPSLSQKMIGGYTASWQKLAPLHKTKMRAIRTSQLQGIIDEHAKTLSRSTLSKIKVLATSLYKYAMREDIVKKNYAVFIKLPGEVKEVKDCFTREQVNRIFHGAADGVPYADCIAMMCYTGYRISEFLSIAPGKIIYADGDMFIRGGMKTDAGKTRIVPVHPLVRPFFDRWLAKGGETLICNEQGQQLTDKRFRLYYYAALEQMGLPRLTPHATRRTFATMLSAAGAKDEEIIAIMGHTNINVDIDHYISPEMQTLSLAIRRIG